jgi:hydroxylamine reductase (hybrid-cluster protein)
MEPDIRTIADGRRPGLALITGCGVRPGEAVSIAQELLQRRVPCLAAGCVAPELAEAGLLYSLKGLPPVIYLGTCRQASRAIQLAERLRDLTGRTDLPLMVAVPGICQPSMAAIALGLAAQGARVHCGAGLPTVGSQEVANWLAAGERYAAGPLFSETEPPTARQIVARLLG